VRHESVRAVPIIPIPSATKQQQPAKDVGSNKQTITRDPHAASALPKKDVHAQVTSAPATAVTQKPSVHPNAGISMPMPYHSQVPVPFGGPIQSQGITTTSLQMPMSLAVGSTSQVQQQVFVPALQSHAIQSQGMMPQAQSLNFATQIGHQMPPQMANMGIGMSPQFQQQQTGKYGGVLRKPVKITHPETHEEVRLDSSGPRAHPTVSPQSQPVPSFNPHPINYYPPMQSNTYNPYYPPTQTAVPLTSTQMTTGSQTVRYSYPIGQGAPSVTFKNPSTLNPPAGTKSGPSVHTGADPMKMEHLKDSQVVTSSVPLPPVQVTVKPPVASLAEKVGSSSATVTSPVVRKGESPKLSSELKEASTFPSQRDNNTGSENSDRQSKAVLEPPASLPSTAASATILAQKSTSSSASASVSSSPSEEPVSIITNTGGRQRETIRRSDSFKDRQKKVGKRDTRNSQLPNQEEGSDPVGTSKSSSQRISRDLTKAPQSIKSPPSDMVELSSSSVSLPQDLGSSSLKVGNPEEGLALIGTSIGPLVSSGEPLPVVRASSDTSSVSDDVRHEDREVSCELSDKSDLQLDGTISENLYVLQERKQDLLEGQMKQECTDTVEPKNELSEGTKEASNSLDVPTEIISDSSETNKQIQIDSNVEETIVGKGCESVGTEQKSEGSGDHCSSETERIADDLIRSASTYAETALSSCVSSTTSHDDKILNVATSTCIDRDYSQDVSAFCSTTSHQESHPEVTLDHETKDTDATSSDMISTSMPGFKDKPPSETNRGKSTAAKGKKKIKDILKAADAAGPTSDLYMAYKGPDEKQESAVISNNVDISSIGDLKDARSGDFEKDIEASEQDGQSKAEPDDWEDAAEMSTPKLTSVVGDQGRENEDGKTSKKYSRDFLLTLTEQCTDLPSGFEIGSDIAEAIMSVQVGISHLVDRETYPSGGRIIDRPSGGPRPERRGVMLEDDKWSKPAGPFVQGRDPRLEGGYGGPVGGFRPGQGGNHGVLRNPRGQPVGQYPVGGLLSGPVQSFAPHGGGGMPRSNVDADRWLRGTGYHKGLIPSPQPPSQMMHKAEKKYKIGEVSDKEQAKQRQLKAILNKLTPQNFDRLFEQVIEVNIDNAVTLTGVISQIFDKALMEPTFCEMYANFCFHLTMHLPDLSEDNEKITFKRLLLNKCQEEFERGEREQAEANRVEEEGEIKCSEQEREGKRIQARRRMLGNIRLIGELYKKKMLTEKIMHECIKKLLGQHQNPDEEDIESLCKLMSTIGEMIDHSKAKSHMDAYFEIMAQLSNNMKLSSRVRFMLKDSIDLRKNKWQQRRKVEGPKKIEEVHRDAAQERQTQAARLARGPSIISSARRAPPPMDFARGSTVVSSTNSQMGGHRGFLPQVRGYAVQDVRMDERHSFESRTLSVPLSQRPLDNNSITLGPQGGLARGMSVRGQPLMSGVPLADIPPPGDPRRFPAGANGYGPASEWTSYAREEALPRSMAMPTYDQLNSQDRNMYLGNRDLWSGERPLDRSMAPAAARLQGTSTVPLAQVTPEKFLSEERLREMSISAIKEFYSAKDKEEVALCIKELNSPSFYPSMISIWVTDSFERKDMERDLLAKLLVDLTKPRDSLLGDVHLMKGFESVLATLEDAVNDAPRAAEFFGRILARVILENVVPLKEIGRLIHEGGEEPGRLQQIGLASEVLANLLEIIKLEKGDSVLNEIRTSSNLRLEDFRPPDPIKSKKLEAFF
ncbi:hypothetical protein IFM89_001308, partial [Coptis chinensis]